MSTCAKLHTRSSNEKKLFTDALKVRPNDDHMTLIISWQYLIICAFVFMHTYTFNRIRNLKFCVTTAKRRHTLWSVPIILADTRCSHKHFNRVKFYPIYLLVYYIYTCKKPLALTPNGCRRTFCEILRSSHWLKPQFSTGTASRIMLILHVCVNKIRKQWTRPSAFTVVENDVNHFGQPGRFCGRVWPQNEMPMANHLISAF